MFDELSSLYPRLLPFYQLIYQSDLQPYKAVDLCSLATRLEAQLAFEKNEIVINKELCEKSKANVAQKLNKKARKMQKLDEQVNKKPSIPLQESQFKIQQSFFINESAALKQSQGFKITQEIEGTIYEGKLLIYLMIAKNKKSKDQKSIIFQVCPENAQTTLSKQVASAIELKESSNILIQGRQIKVILTDSKQSKIGLNYLRNYNILLNLNYRPEKSNFNLRFSS